MRELSFPRDTISNGARDIYRTRAAELIGHNDRMDEPRRTVRISDIDAVPIVGPRGGIRRYTTICFRDDVCEDGDAEDTMIARLDGPGDGDDERDDEDREERDWDDEDEHSEIFVAGVSLDEYLAEEEASVLETVVAPLPPMTERDAELFGIIATLIDVPTAEAARREGTLLALSLVLDEMTAPTPEPQPAEEIESRLWDPIDGAWADGNGGDDPRFGKAFETAPGLELSDLDDLDPQLLRSARALDHEEGDDRRRQRRVDAVSDDPDLRGMLRGHLGWIRS